MPIDNQLCRARVGIYNSNQLHQLTSLKINPANLDICFIFEIFKCLHDHRLFNTIDIFLTLSDFDTGT